MCTAERIHLLKSRVDWQDRLKEMFAKDEDQEDFVSNAFMS